MLSHSICWLCCYIFTSAGGVCTRPHGEVLSSECLKMFVFFVFFVYNNYVVLSNTFIPFHHSRILQRRNLFLCRRTVTLYNNTPLTNRLVSWLSAGVGSLCQTCHSKHAHDLSIVVDIWNRRIPGWCDKWGWAGSSVHSLPAVHHGLHGNSLLRRPLAVAAYSSHSGITPLI